MVIIDGKKVAASIRDALRRDILQNKLIPKLVFILVGDHPPSKAYVSMKEKACREVGIISEKRQLDETTTEEQLIRILEDYNQNESVHGILVQMPLPNHIDEQRIIHTISPEKDVDCFHPYNVGLMTTGQTTGFFPCTPYGVITLLDHYKIHTAGKHAVILGRSNIVGRPLSILLSQKGRDATVTVAHSHTKQIKDLCRSADILIAAIGQPNFVTHDMVKSSAVVIDVGINRVNGALCGDVDYENVAPLCSAITPVPGGVGPMTVAVLLQNTLKSCKIAMGIYSPI